MKNDLTPTASPRLLHEIRIQLVENDGAVNIQAQTTADPLISLGILEAAKDALKQQPAQPRSPLVIANGRIPRV